MRRLVAFALVLILIPLTYLPAGTVADIDEGGDIIAPITPGEPIIGESLDAITDDLDIFWFTTEGGIAVIDLVGPVDADFDLYLTEADTEIELGASEGFAAVESIATVLPGAGTYWIMVYAYTGGGEYNLTFDLMPVTDTDTSADAPGTLVLDGAGVQETIDEVTDALDYYLLDIPTGKVINLILSGPLGTDFDLFVTGPDGTSLGQGAALGTPEEEVVFRVEIAGAHLITVWAYSGSGLFSLSASEVTSAGGDSADDPTLALEVDLDEGPVTLSETIGTGGDDDDHFAVSIPGGMALLATLIGPAAADLDLFLYDPTYEIVAASTGAGANEFLSYSPTDPGFHVVDVWAYEGSGTYTLTLELVVSSADDSRDQESAQGLILGEIATGDVDERTDPEDWYRFDLPTPGRLDLSLVGLDGDIDLYIFDADAVFVVGSEGLGPVERLLNQEFSEPGTYYILVAAFSGKTTYSLNITYSQPNNPPTVAITSPAAGTEVGGMLTVRGTADDPDGAGDLQAILLRLDDGGWVDLGPESPWETTFSTASLTPGTHTVSVVADDGLARSAEASVAVVVPEPLVEGPSGDGTSEANAIDLAPGTVDSRLAFDRDPERYYSFDLSVDQQATVDFVNASGDLDPDLFLFDPDRRLVTFSELPDASDVIDFVAERSGTYIVLVFAYSGTGEYVLRLAIEDLPPQPQALFTFSPDPPVAGSPVTLDATISVDPTDIATYTWDFGDGSVGTGMTIDHVFAASGTYLVELQVDTGEASSKLTRVVKVASTAGSGELDTWTLLIWGAADNDLEAEMMGDLEEMEQVDLPTGLNVIVQLDRTPGYDTSDGDWTTTRRFQVAYDPGAGVGSRLIEDLGEINMGDGDELEEFVRWGIATYPAERYGLIIWDHGGAVVGVAWDDTSNGDNLRIAEIRQALAGDGIPTLDLIGFDACVMATLEVAYELRGEVRAMVASEESEQGDGWPYDTVLRSLAADPSMSGLDLAEVVVDRYAEATRRWNDQTQSALDLTKIADLAAKANDLAIAISAVMDESGGTASVLEAHERVDRYYEDTHVDLLQWAELIQAEHRAREGSDLAAAVTDLRASLEAVVVASYSGSQHRNSNGLSVFMPTQDNYYLTRYPGSFQFASNSVWDDLVADFQDARVSRSRAAIRTAPTTAELVPELRIEGGVGEGDTVTVHLRLTNQGSLDALAVRVEIRETRGFVKADPMLVADLDLGTVTSRETHEELISWIPGSVGDLSLRAVVNWTDSTGESQEVTRFLNQYVAPKGADLSGRILPTDYQRGSDGTVQVPVEVRNTGQTFAKLATVHLIERAPDGSETTIGTALLLDLEAGDTQTTAFRWNPTAGDHTLRLVVAGKADSYSSNNFFETTTGVITGEGEGGTGDPGADRDGDGVPDDNDAFPDDPAASTDTDGDGMPDSLSGASNTLIEDDDDDNDGYTDREEIQAGSDPLSASSTPADPTGSNGTEDNGTGLCGVVLLIPMVGLLIAGGSRKRRRRK